MGAAVCFAAGADLGGTAPVSWDGRTWALWEGRAGETRRGRPLDVSEPHNHKP